jgi:NADH dehydrogenase FAD-containing subunit
MNRQQHRQAARRQAREVRVGTAVWTAGMVAENVTKGYNRADRRFAYKATRLRNDGRPKRFARALPTRAQKEFDEIAKQKEAVS